MERNGDVEKAILAEMAKPGSALIERVTRHNQIILHNYRKSVDKNLGCQLLGCRLEFPVTLVPNQVLYPKYCPDHRSEFRRKDFLRRCAMQENGYRLETFRIIESAPR